MKKIIFILVILTGLYSCSGLNASKVRHGVIKKFPQSVLIISPPGRFATFIVIDKDSTVWYVESIAIFNADKFTTDSLYSLKTNKFKTNEKR
jgi:hypothetical protein